MIKIHPQYKISVEIQYLKITIQNAKEIIIPNTLCLEVLLLLVADPNKDPKDGNPPITRKRYSN